MNSPIDLQQFPSTRYQGSKRKMIPWLYKIFKEIEFETVLDAFGGSASVSYLMKKMGKSVTYNDYLKFNYYVGKAIIENSSTILSKLDIERFYTNKNIITQKIVQNNFENIYYYPEENVWIDNTVNLISSMNSNAKNVLEYKKAIAFYALFQACLIKRPFNLFHRKNLYLRNNNVERSFGNFISWEKPFEYYFQKFINEANSLIFNNMKRCESLNKSVFEIKENNYDLVYLDPPYFRKNSSNETSFYKKNYHFLEGLANYSDWEKLIDENTPNKRFKAEGTSQDFGTENMIDSFEKLFEQFRQSKIVVSYKSGGIPSINKIVSLLKKRKKIVFTKSIHYKYALNHQNGDAKKNREVLIIGL